jgi:hypothetical protein
MLGDNQRRAAMSRQIEQLARPHAAWHVATMLRDLAGSQVREASSHVTAGRRAMAAAALV